MIFLILAIWIRKIKEVSNMARYRLNQKGKVAVMIILMAFTATLYLLIKKVMTPPSPFRKDATYSCIILRKEGSAPFTTLFESFGVYCPEVQELGEVKINFVKGGEKVSTFRGAKFPHEIKLDGGKLHQAGKKEWDYEEKPLLFFSFI